MNELNLRISGNGTKSKPLGLAVAPVNFPDSVKECISKLTGYEKFVEPTSAEDQLATLKTIIKHRHNLDDDFLTFIVLVYFHADHKHPVKSFLSRYVIKNVDLQKPFADSLAREVKSKVEVALTSEGYKWHMDMVHKIIACSENFPTGVVALKKIEVSLIDYLTVVLDCCEQYLDLRKGILSPTEKNEIFNVTHLSQRAILNVIQKITNENKNKLMTKFSQIQRYVTFLLNNNDTPMDIRTVCGLLYINLHILMSGTWEYFLQKHPSCFGDIHPFPVELSLLSAIATTIPTEDLESTVIENRPGILILSEKIMDIGESHTTESSCILAVTRAVVQLSKMLDRLRDTDLGAMLVSMFLTFVWSHLDHYMDSVRHLTAQALNNIVKYCTKLQRKGNNAALDSLFSSIETLSATRKGYFVSVTALIQEIGAIGVLAKIPRAIDKLIEALNVQNVQASATTTLECLLQQHIKEVDIETIHKEWIISILQHISSNFLESSVLNILENLLAKAVKWGENIIDYILPHIKKSAIEGDSTFQSGELKCVLILLHVARKSGVIDQIPNSEDLHHWKGILSYDILKYTAIHPSEEMRILSLALIVESPKSTEEFSSGDLDFILYFLKYNINTQSPNFRQQMLALLKKFMKRVEESYKVLKRQSQANKLNYYTSFVDSIRSQCFDSLFSGANYSRRCVALNLLLHAEIIQLEGYERTWKEDYVERLLNHLDDSYEVNKSNSLQILQHCPLKLLMSKKYSDIISLEVVLKQASSVKPTDCVSAAYKFQLLKMKLPNYILKEKQSNIPEAVSYHLLSRLLERLIEELEVGRRSILLAATYAPMYGILHCICHLLQDVDYSLTSKSDHWTKLLSNTIQTSMQINQVVAPVVNNSSPEGHLPMDFEPGAKHLEGNGLVLDDGTKVTAQMVLLCAWRSVKEVSLLLGEISNQCKIQGESSTNSDESGNLTVSQVLDIQEHFITLLSETKHRGAFEQAYVGFTCLLTRLWRSSLPELHSGPLQCLSTLLRQISGEEESRTLCGTRRGAGLPYMIQALVTTELQVSANPARFDDCMRSLLRLARGEERRGESGGVGELHGEREGERESRVHALNILRALVRHAALRHHVAPHVAAALQTAVLGFEGRTWPERNSSTLLLSALMVRVFGVARARRHISIRNMMTGRIFFLRYPQLYDFMLEKLKECTISDVTESLHPALYPILIILSRLYPSSLEGSVSNLKLETFRGDVSACGSSRSLLARRLAAAALAPLVPLARLAYLSHLRDMFTTICDPNIKRNYCHGVLLQILKLLEACPEGLKLEHEPCQSLTQLVNDSNWILIQGLTNRPCYPLVDEYVKILNCILRRFSEVINQEIVKNIEILLQKLIFNEKPKFCHPGRDICLSNSIYLYIIILSKYHKGKLIDCMISTLSHHSYEVILSVLNCILILHDNLELENMDNINTHWKEIINRDEILKELQNHPKYLESVAYIFNNHKYIECKQKSLTILSLEKYVENSNMADEEAIKKIMYYIQNEHENLTHIYLNLLKNFLSNKFNNKEMFENICLDVLTTVYQCSYSDNNDNIRRVVVEFMEENCLKFLNFTFTKLNKSQIFEYKTTVWATLVTLLEDDEDIIRQKTTTIVVNLLNNHNKHANKSNITVPSKGCEILRDIIEAYHETDDTTAVYLLLALIDFKAEVCIVDELNDECRVFDQNEKYNIFMEETVWTIECMKKIAQLHSTLNRNELKNLILDVINNPIYIDSYKKICDGQLVIMSRVNALQMQNLLDILSEEGVLTHGNVAYHLQSKQEFWKNVARQLNSIQGGVHKTPYKWCKMWADWKNKTKNKAKRSVKKLCDGDGTKPTFTLLEYRLLKLISFPVDSLDTEVLENSDELNTKEMETTEYLESDGDWKSFEYVDDNMKDEDGFLPEGNEEESDEQDYFKHDKKKTKQKDKNTKKRKLDSSVNNHSENNRQNDIEQHKLRQKDEELRLRAIELKLKAQELKLKEAEMNKVNTLVNIEEDKLRCFKDITSLLKELVDRTKNGNPGRYNII